MKVLERKNLSIKRAITELKTLSKTAKAHALYESCRKAELDYVSGLNDAFKQGLNEGIQKGIEGFYLGIQLNLESRFNLKDSSIIKSIRKIKDVEQLKEILILSAKAKELYTNREQD